MMTSKQKLTGLLSGNQKALDGAINNVPPVHAVLQVVAPEGYEAKSTDHVTLYGTGERVTVAEWEALNANANATPILSTLKVEGATFINSPINYP